jgi:hypothetical protein
MKHKLILLIIILIIICFLIVWFIYLNPRMLSDKYTYLIKNLSDNDPNITRDRIIYPVYYINLDRDVQRNNEMIEQFSKYHITNPTRIQAIYGKGFNSLKKGEDQGIKFTNTFKLSAGELGCTLSHLCAIRKGYEDGHEFIVVMEDDAGLDLIPYWPFDLPVLIGNIKEDWNVIQMTCSTYSSFNNDNIITPWKSNYYGTAAYVINRKGMSNVLSQLYINGVFVLDKQKNPKFTKKSGVSDRLIYESAGKTFTLNKSLFFTLDVKSTIKSYNRSKFIKNTINTLKYYT